MENNTEGTAIGLLGLFILFGMVLFGWWMLSWETHTLAFIAAVGGIISILK